MIRVYLYGIYDTECADGFFIKLEDVKRIRYVKNFWETGGQLFLKDGTTIKFKKLETAGGAEIAIKKMKELVESENKK